MKSLLNRFWNDESGQGLTEYVLIIALVAVGLILVLGVFRNAIGGVFDSATTQLNSAKSTQYTPGT
jgi:pilus assembly protein Flp/PilA